MLLMLVQALEHPVLTSFHAFLKPFTTGLTTFSMNQFHKPLNTVLIPSQHCLAQFLTASQQALADSFTASKAILIPSQHCLAQSLIASQHLIATALISSQCLQQRIMTAITAPMARTANVIGEVMKPQIPEAINPTTLNKVNAPFNTPQAIATRVIPTANAPNISDNHLPSPFSQSPNVFKASLIKSHASINKSAVQETIGSNTVSQNHLNVSQNADKIGFNILNTPLRVSKNSGNTFSIVNLPKGSNISVINHFITSPMISIVGFIASSNPLKEFFRGSKLIVPR